MIVRRLAKPFMVKVVGEDASSAQRPLAGSGPERVGARNHATRRCPPCWPMVRSDRRETVTERGASPIHAENSYQIK